MRKSIRRWVIMGMALFGSLISRAQEPLASYQWKNRLVLIRVDDFQNADYQQQRELYLNKINKLKDRQLLIFGVGEVEVKSWYSQDVNFTTEQAQWLRRRYLQHARQVLIGKDGGVKLETNQQFTLEQLFETIDQMPMRRAEMRKKGLHEE